MLKKTSANFFIHPPLIVEPYSGNGMSIIYRVNSPSVYDQWSKPLPIRQHSREKTNRISQNTAEQLTASDILARRALERRAHRAAGCLEESHNFPAIT
jgi:hypothetical protein